MSVRKRLWFTNAQIWQRAERMAVAAGKHADSWQMYRDAAQAEADALLRKLRDSDSAAADAALKGIAPKDRPKDAWVVYLGKGKDRHQETCDSKKEADDYERKARGDIAKGTHTPSNKSLTVAEAAEVWIKRVEANGMRGDGPAERSTTRQYRQHVDLHIVPRIGKDKIAKLTKAHAEKFRDELLAAMTRELARKVWTSFKSILKTQSHTHIVADLTIGKKKRDERKLEVGVDIPAPEETARMLNVAGAAATATNKPADLKRHALLITASQCGLRASELRGLRWIDVDLKSATLSVSKRADRFNKTGTPKSASSRRKIPLSSDVVQALQRWQIACPPGKEGLVFPSSTGAVEHHANMLRSLGPVMKAAGVVKKNGKPRYALHAFRHFFASWCINPKDRGGRNLPPKVVQTLLGHESIKMTYDLYGHLFPDGGDRAELEAASRALLA
jgi:integrase